MLIHMWDNLEDSAEPWRPCRSGWCAGRVDHMSCSLINRRLPVLFTYGLGLILSPREAEFVCACACAPVARTALFNHGASAWNLGCASRT